MPGIADKFTQSAQGRLKWPGMTNARIVGSHRLFRPTAKIVDQAYLATRLAREASVAPVQDQPVMGMLLEFAGHHALKAKLHLERRIARGKAGSIGDAEYVR